MAFCYCCVAIFFRHIKLVQQFFLLIFTNAPTFPQLRFQYNGQKKKTKPFFGFNKKGTCN